jgi:hypothetical protein
MTLNAKDTNLFVTSVRIEATNLIRTLQKLRNLRQKLDALGSTIDNPDIGGDNVGITRDQVVAVLGTTLEAFEVVYDSGHKTNLHTIAII